jgi:hypothetical protein
VFDAFCILIEYCPVFTVRTGSDQAGIGCFGEESDWCYGCCWDVYLLGKCSAARLVYLPLNLEFISSQRTDDG